MEFQRGNNCIYVGNSETDNEAVINYQPSGEGEVNITHTGVDSSLRGQGVAGKLVDEVVKRAREEGFKLRATCSYAKEKLETTEDYQDVYLG